MKKTLFYIMGTLCFLLKAQAVENLSLPLHIVNTVWEKKTQLSGLVVYSDQKEHKFSSILNAATKDNPTPLKTVNVPFGNIEQIDLSLHTYPETPDDESLAAKLLGSVTFEPWIPSVKEVVFIIRHEEITPKPIFTIICS